MACLCDWIESASVLCADTKHRSDVGIRQESIAGIQQTKSASQAASDEEAGEQAEQAHKEAAVQKKKMVDEAKVSSTWEQPDQWTLYPLCLLSSVGHAANRPMLQAHPAADCNSLCFYTR